MDPPVVTVSGINIRITWTPPINTGGSPITQYKIVIADNNAISYIEELTYCDGSQATVISNLYCEIPMSVLRTSP